MNNNNIFCCSLSDQAKTTLTFRFETTNTHASAGHERLLPVPIHEIFDSIHSHIKVTYKSNNFIISHEKSVLPHFLYPQFIVFFRVQPLEAVIQFWHFVKDVILLEKKSIWWRECNLLKICHSVNRKFLHVKVILHHSPYHFQSFIPLTGISCYYISLSVSLVAGSSRMGEARLATEANHDIWQAGTTKALVGWHLLGLILTDAKKPLKCRDHVVY